MSETKYLNIIPEIVLTDFQNYSDGLIILELSDIKEKYSEMISNPHRSDFYQLFFL